MIWEEVKRLREEGCYDGIGYLKEYAIEQLLKEGKLSGGTYHNNCPLCERYLHRYTRDTCEACPLARYFGATHHVTKGWGCMPPWEHAVITTNPSRMVYVLRVLVRREREGRR